MPFKNQHPLYTVWQSMRARCRNPNNSAFKNYGGRGITICDRWDDFHTWLADMGPRPQGASLDRIDNDGNYSPENCRWATKKEQQRNTRKVVFVTVEGVTRKAVELFDICGLKPETIVARAAKGLTLEQVLSKSRIPNRTNWRKAVAAQVRKAKEKTHCRVGHVFDEANTYTNKQGWRLCRQCHNEKMRRYTAMKAEARAK